MSQRPAIAEQTRAASASPNIAICRVSDLKFDLQFAARTKRRF